MEPLWCRAIATSVARRSWKCSATSRRSRVGPRPSVLRPNRGAERRQADVGPATPIAGDLPERQRTGPATIGRAADAVDAGADDHGDAPSFVGSGAQDGERVVGDRVARRTAEPVDRPVQRSLFGGQIGAGHEPRAELGDLPAVRRGAPASSHARPIRRSTTCNDPSRPSVCGDEPGPRTAASTEPRVSSIATSVFELPPSTASTAELVISETGEDARRLPRGGRRATVRPA